MDGFVDYDRTRAFGVGTSLLGSLRFELTWEKKFSEERSRHMNALFASTC